MSSASSPGRKNGVSSTGGTHEKTTPPRGNSSKSPAETQKSTPQPSPTSKNTPEVPSKSSNVTSGKVPISPPKAGSRSGQTSPRTPGKIESHGEKNRRATPRTNNLETATANLHPYRPGLLGPGPLDDPLMNSNARLYCYIIDVHNDKFDDGSSAAFQEFKARATSAFIREVLPRAESCIFTDHKGFVASPVGLPSSLTDVAPLQQIKATVGLVSWGSIQWSNVLDFLNCAAMPPGKDGAIDEQAAGAILSTLDMLSANPYWNEAFLGNETKLMKVLDVRSHSPDSKLKGRDPKSTVQSERQSLAKLIQEYQAQQGSSLRGLEIFLKGRRVQLANGTNDSDQEKTGVKMTIVGLARPDDGRDSQDPHPNVDAYGGNSHEVEFYYASDAKSRDGSDTPAGSSPGRYITVAEYFRIKRGAEPENLILPLVNDVLEPRKGTTSQFTRSELFDITTVVDAQKFLENCSKKHHYRLPGLKVLPRIDGVAYPIGVVAGTVLAPCRLLKSPSIEYQDRKVVDTKFGAWKTNLRAIQKGKAHQLVVLRIGVGCIPGTVENEIIKTQEALQKRLSEHGINLSLDLSLKPIAIQGFEKAMEDEIAKAGKQKKFTAVLVVLPDNKRPLYDGVKRQLDVALGLQNICVVASSFSTGKPDTKSPVKYNAKEGATKEPVEELNGLFSQIALKLNLKAGGQNQILTKRDLKSIRLESTMLVGFETIAPPKKAHGGAKAIAAIVASENEHLSQWPAGMTILGKKSIEAELADLVLGRMKFWKGKDGQKYPENIIIYYNNLGVKHGSGGTEKVANLKAAWEAAYKEARLDANARPELTVIAVNKDHQAQLRTPSSIDKERAQEKIPQETILVRTSGKDEDKAWEFVVQGHKPLKVNCEDTRLPELYASKATVPIRYTVLENRVFGTAEAKAELENLTDNLRYLSGCSPFAITDTLPIHYVELLSQRIQSYVRPWYYPTNRKAEMEDMLQNNIQVHDDVARTMFYV